ncbi:MAG: FAD/NAD(P)-binding protein [Alphaproteobacteria bacterium]|nr:FAD/NAD(P)-binding protein [Alphaproteobacteria bacterium]
MRIAIVGAGFTGSLAAARLLQRSRQPGRIQLIDRRGHFGPGLAYSTGNASHLLNVRAGNMSALADDPGHFVRWLEERLRDGDAGDIEGAGALAFVSRTLYGRYIQDVLADARRLAAAEGGPELETVYGDVVRVEPLSGGVTLHFAGGQTLDADRALLCLGNFPPVAPASVLEQPALAAAYIDDPWRPGAFERIGDQDSVAIIGAGLTMVDIALMLNDQGHRGRITALSRRGFLPFEHAPATAVPAAPELLAEPVTARGLLRQIRAVAGDGSNWRGVIDGLRPVTQTLWQAMGIGERQRLMRHLRPYWEVRRHRMAPSVAARIAAMLEAGRLDIRAGRILGIERAGEHIALHHAPRKASAPETLRVDWIVNCTGPQSDYGRIADPLVRDLLAAGHARPDPLRLGLDVTPACRLINAAGQPVETLIGLGPVTRGNFWEITAVPDIRTQVARIVDDLVDGLADRA